MDKKHILKRIRKHLLFLGFDLNCLNDKKLESSIISSSEILSSNMGFTIKEFSGDCYKFGKMGFKIK